MSNTTSIGQSEVTLKDGKTELKTVTKEISKSISLDPTKPHAKIGVSRGFTKNLGNFQSIKGEVWVELPMNIDPADVEGSVKANALEVGTYISHLTMDELQDAIEWSREG